MQSENTDPTFNPQKKQILLHTPPAGWFQRDANPPGTMGSIFHFLFIGQGLGNGPATPTNETIQYQSKRTELVPSASTRFSASQNVLINQGVVKIVRLGT